MKKLLSDHGTAARFVRFLGVGVLNTGFGYLMFALLVFAGLGPQPALALAFAVGILWNYLTHARLVFGTAGSQRLLPYAAAYGVIYLINAGALHYALSLGFAPLVAQFVLVLPMAALSFIFISYVLTGHLPFGAAHRQDIAQDKGQGPAEGNAK